MISKTIKYKDYNGNDREDTFWFHLNKPELIELEVSEAGGLEETIKRLTVEKNAKKIVEIFKQVLFKAYGKKTPDGRFVKSDELSKEFSETAAYEILYMELATNADESARFFNGVIPRDE